MMKARRTGLDTGTVVMKSYTVSNIELPPSSYCMKSAAIANVHLFQQPSHEVPKENRQIPLRLLPLSPNRTALKDALLPVTMSRFNRFPESVSFVYATRAAHPDMIALLSVLTCFQIRSFYLPARQESMFTCRALFHYAFGTITHLPARRLILPETGSFLFSPNRYSAHREPFRINTDVSCNSK